MNLKPLFVKILREYIFPMITKATKEWATPYEIDDAAWAIIEERLNKYLDSIDDEEVVSSLMKCGSAFPVKALFISFLETVVFPVIDEYVENTPTTFEWDDKAWKVLKAQIRKYVDSMTFSGVGEGSYGCVVPS